MVSIGQGTQGDETCSQKDRVYPVMENVEKSWNSIFYPTALKGCRGIVFTHGVRAGGRGEKFVRTVSQKP